MEFRLDITHNYLGIPVKTASVKEQDLHSLEFYSQDQKIMEFKIPVTKQSLNIYDYDYLAYVKVEEYKGRELRLNGKLPLAFFEQVTQIDEPKHPLDARPKIHFTAERGWINDPNGLLFHDGIWHLFFQYNPMNTEWENMSWGHAVSNDLLHWQQKDTAMYPDEHGTVFSGCGLVNERGLFGLPKHALLFFYTAAGGTSKWSEGKQFVQRMAYSLDGGKTLTKHNGWELCLYQETEGGQEKQLPRSAYENRDPKIFWHEDSKAYIMVLFLDAHDFAVLRSENLEDWEKTQHLAFEDAWECPDLMKLNADDGTEHWVFWSADGFYFLGAFDGWKFTDFGKRKEAYGTKLPYAAQTYWGISDRSISVAWLRTRHEGHLYTGAMALPRELSLAKTGDGYKMRLAPIKELEQMWESFQTLYMTNGCVTYQEPGRPFYLLINWKTGEPESAFLTMGETRWKIDRKHGIIEYYKTPSQLTEVFTVPDGKPLSQLCVIVDCGVVEITANYDIIYLVYESTDYQIDGFLTYEGDEADIRVASLKSEKQ